MQLRISTWTRGSKTYHYGQLVESYRRDSDGTPMHRVVGNLGRLTPAQADNLRLALAAGRCGQRVAVVPGVRSCGASVPKPVANLRYLDVAVLVALWRQWGLPELLDSLLPAGAKAVSASSVITALAVQRCVDPGSKLRAARWFPHTALPLLLGIAPNNFNNTRLHRVLAAIDAAGAKLMSELPGLYESRHGAFASLFLDVTDTWFVGHGPDLAQRGKTKEGMVQRKIGIVLLCNEHGYPLRWEVIAGNTHDGAAMTQMLESIAQLDWARSAPVVCDRAMGKTAQIRKMLATELRFLTALTTPEFGAYSSAIPHQPFAALTPSAGAEEVTRAEIAYVAGVAEKAGLMRVEDDLFVLDLGIVERPDLDVAEPGQRAPDATATESMRLCRAMDLGIKDGRYPSCAAAGRAHGLSKALASKYRQLNKLNDDLQQLVIEGRAAGSTLAELIRVARVQDSQEQHAAFAKLYSEPPNGRKASVAASNVCEPPKAPKTAAAHILRVRAVAYFNPRRFVDERRRAQRHLEDVHNFVTELNTRLSTPRSRLDRNAIAASVDRKLRSYDFVDAFELKLDEHEVAGRARFSVTLALKPEAWERRRRYDGFAVLAAHPKVEASAAELCRLYRAKDAVEKDFRTIKSIVELRPVWHHNNAKVRAHVTICMLALLLERTIAHRLGGTDGQAALETLASCALNRYRATNGTAAYTITEPDADQASILKRLGLKHLADDKDVTSQPN